MFCRSEAVDREEVLSGDCHIQIVRTCYCWGHERGCGYHVSISHWSRLPVLRFPFSRATFGLRPPSLTRPPSPLQVPARAPTSLNTRPPTFLRIKNKNNI
jgi:hypothetical protein